MIRMDIYARAKQFYNSKFVPERRNILQDLFCVRKYILHEGRRHAIANFEFQRAQTAGIGLLVAGIIAAPFTRKCSVCFLGAGISATTTLFAIYAMLKKVRARKIRELIFKAKQSLIEHDKTCLEMYKLLQMLNEYQESTGDQEERYFSLLRDFNLPSRIVTFARKIVDIRAVLFGVIIIEEMNAGKIFDEASKILKVIDELGRQNTKFHFFFNTKKFR